MGSDYVISVFVKNEDGTFESKVKRKDFNRIKSALDFVNSNEKYYKLVPEFIDECKANFIKDLFSNEIVNKKDNNSWFDVSGPLYNNGNLRGEIYSLETVEYASDILKELFDTASIKKYELCKKLSKIKYLKLSIEEKENVINSGCFEEAKESCEALWFCYEAYMLLRGIGELFKEYNNEVFFYIWAE